MCVNLLVATLCATLAACGGAPRRPGAANSKSPSSTLVDRCIDARDRNQPPPAGCETVSTTQPRARPLPDLQQDPFLAPGLPSGLGSVGNAGGGIGVLRR